MLSKREINIERLTYDILMQKLDKIYHTYELSLLSRSNISKIINLIKLTFSLYTGLNVQVIYTGDYDDGILTFDTDIELCIMDSINIDSVCNKTKRK